MSWAKPVAVKVVAVSQPKTNPGPKVLGAKVVKVLVLTLRKGVRLVRVVAQAVAAVESAQMVAVMAASLSVPLRR